MKHLPFDKPGRFWKGNLHTHCTQSDGRLTTEQVRQKYQDAGYDFVNWTGDVVSTANPITLTTVTSDTNITANFALTSVGVEIENDPVSVAEGGSSNIRIRLSAQPAGERSRQG